MSYLPPYHNLISSREVGAFIFTYSNVKSKKHVIVESIDFRDLLKRVIKTGTLATLKGTTK